MAHEELTMDELEKQAAELRAEIDKRNAALAASLPLADEVQLGGELAVLRRRLADVETQMTGARTKAEQAAADSAATVASAQLVIQRALLEVKNTTVHLDPEAIRTAASAFDGRSTQAKAAKGLADALGAFRDAVTAFEAAAA